MVVSNEAAVLYKTTDFYSAEHERTVLWNDSELKIDWPLDVAPILSENNHAGLTLQEAETYA